MIKLKTKPILNQTSDFDVAYVDGDIVAFMCAAAADGHIYRIIDPRDKMLLFEARYKKDINKWFKERPNVPREWLTDDYEPEDIKTVTHSVKQMTTSILSDIGAKEYKIFLSGKDNFRYKINPKYKANRKNVRRPYHLKNTQQYLIDHWGAEIIDGWEADDQLGIEQMKEDGKLSVIASIDKDLHCVPGWHYEWPHYGKESKLTFVTKIESLFNFYKQVLTGDSTDHIFGIHGVGKVKAKRIIEGSNLKRDEDLYQVVLDTYQQYKNPLRVGFKSQVKWAEKRVLFVARQIYILQREGEMWEAPKTKI